MRNLIRQIAFICTIVLTIILFTGCSSKERTPKPNRQVEIFLNAIQQSSEDSSLPTTRTTIGGEALDRTYWSERDTIQLYWRNTGSRLKQWTTLQFLPIRSDTFAVQHHHG